MTHDTQAGSPTTTSVQHAETDASTSRPHAASADADADTLQQQLAQAQEQQAVRDSEDAILRQQLARSQEQQEASQAEVESLRAELADARQHIRSLEAELQDTMDAAMQLWDTIQVSDPLLPQSFSPFLQCGGGGGLWGPDWGRGGEKGEGCGSKGRAELADARQHIRSLEAELQDTMDAAMQLWDTIQVSSFDPCRAATQGWHPGGGGGGLGGGRPDVQMLEGGGVG